MRTIALAGNPNSGKTTVFNKLTGSSQRVGNWPGVTIDRKEGRIKGVEDTVLVDLPGIYSLSPYSPEEIVSRDYIVNEKPDLILNVVDASNLERNLYLTVQLLEMGTPVVMILNMMDLAAAKGISVSAANLGRMLGCTVVETTASKGTGIDDVKKALATASKVEPIPQRFEPSVEDAIAKAEEGIRSDLRPELRRWAAIKVIERDEKASEYVREGFDAEPIIKALEDEYDDSSESIITDQRYNSICDTVSGCLNAPVDRNRETFSDKVDRYVTNKWLGLPIFVAVMYGVYYLAVQTIGTMGTDWVNDVFFGEWVLPAASDWLANASVNEALSGFVVEGLIGGVGAVLGFLPQMLVMFLLLAILEEIGYMSRIAFVMDRIFRRFGLSGKSFIPVMVGMGCGVPGVMASRTIESDRDRRITAMTTTFIPCSAKLPIIALIAGALFGGSAAIALSAYLIGILCILMSGIILKKWKSFVGEPSPFIMELPPYHLPSVMNMVMSVLQRGWAFVKKAGTFILVACALVWVLSSFNWSLEMVDADASMLASIGNAVGFIFAPLGFGDWQFTVATVTGLLAKENVVGTLGVLFGFAEVSEAGEEFWALLAGMITPLAGFSFLLFNLICAPCFAAIGAMHRELGTWKATAFGVGYQCLLAYAVSVIVYQFGLVILYQTVEPIGIVMAVIALAAIAFLLIAKDPFGTIKSKVEAVTA